MTTRFARLLCTMLCWVQAMLPGMAASLEPATMVRDFHNLYSPFRFDDYLWMGGWLKAPERVPWPDRIFQSRLNSKGEWTYPEPIRWVASQSRYPRGQIPGFHINDPVVLQDPENARWVMLYTAFPNDAIDSTACDPSVNPTDCLDVKRHAVGWMFSYDDGDTWEDQGILLRSPTGVWSPGAVIRGSELWVYYMDATLPVEDSALWRQRVSLLGMAPIGPPDRLMHPGKGMSNPDLYDADGRLYLAANRLRASQVVVYESDDGIVFREPACWRNPILDLRGTRLDGPHIVSVRPIALLTGFNKGAGSERVVHHRVSDDRRRCDPD